MTAPGAHQPTFISGHSEKPRTIINDNRESEEKHSGSLPAWMGPERTAGSQKELGADLLSQLQKRKVETGAHIGSPQPLARPQQGTPGTLTGQTSQKGGGSSPPEAGAEGGREREEQQLEPETTSA